MALVPVVRLFVMLLVVFAVVPGADAASSSTTAAEEAAVQAAEAWLMLVDQGKHEESWRQAAEYFKAAITAEDWQKSLRGVRAPLGAVVSRTVRSKKYRTALPGAPDGKYVVIQFATTYRNKAKATETVTPMLDRDGVWRVSGYFIK